VSARFPVLVINSGSSSLKLSILDPEKATTLATGIAESLFTDGAILKLTGLEGYHFD
jgi:acetate kinase